MQYVTNKVKISIRNFINKWKKQYICTFYIVKNKGPLIRPKDKLSNTDTKLLYTIKGGFQKPIVEAAFELILLVIFDHEFKSIVD